MPQTALDGSGLDDAGQPVQLSPEQRLRLHGLTARECEVALLAGRGLLVREIAERLQIAIGTVKALLRRAREKLNCRTVRELSTLLVRAGLIRPEELFLPQGPSLG